MSSRETVFESGVQLILQETLRGAPAFGESRYICVIYAQRRTHGSIKEVGYVQQEANTEVQRSQRVLKMCRTRFKGLNGIIAGDPTCLRCEHPKGRPAARYKRTKGKAGGDG